MRSLPIVASVVVLPIAFLAGGCGGDNARTSTVDRPRVEVSADGASDGDTKLVRNDTVDMDGWTDASWAKLGGRPEDWPVDLVPPLATERATLVVQRDSNGDVTILSGRVPSDPDTLEDQIEDSFASWEEVEGVGVDDVVGTWERDGSHVMVTVREDGDGATYGIIRRDS